MTRNFLTVVVFVSTAIWASVCLAGGETTHFVDADATGVANGTNWNDAFTTLQDALDAAYPDDQIWVAAGTYKPSTLSGRNATFTLKAGVYIYGGFNATETDLVERDPETNVTILSGDIGTANVATDNCYHVVFCNVSAILDGFTIRDGYANDSYQNSGAGVQNQSPSALVIRNCILTNNFASYSGGALTALPGMTVEDCVFTDNVVSGSNARGGALGITGLSSMTISGCAFSGNSSSYIGGAVMDNTSYAGAVFQDCLFEDNTAVSSGGAAYSYGGIVLENCRFEGNQVTAPTYAFTNGGGAVNSGGWLTAEQCVFTDNTIGEGYGGAISTRNCWIDRCQFLTNEADRFSENASGGAIYCRFGISEDSQISNCLFFGNMCGLNGSAVVLGYTGQATLVIANCTISGGLSENLQAYDIGMISSDLGNNSLVINNSIIYRTALTPVQPSSDVTINYSDIEFGWSGNGTGNIASNPLFVDWGTDFQLDSGSPCLDAGSNGLVPSDADDYDLSGNTRIVNTVDMGALEAQ